MILDEDYLNIVKHILNSNDLDSNNNELAITNHPLYRFYNSGLEQTYQKYKEFCYEYGFRALNIINFEVKSKFIKEYMKRKKIITEIKIEDLPF